MPLPHAHAHAAGLGSIILLAATLLSLWLANSSHAESWLSVWHTHLGPASLGLHLSLREWVNEGLMAVFFFVVGVDIKKEFVYGSLASIRKAVLPCLGALGGMVVPMVRAQPAPAAAPAASCPVTPWVPQLTRHRRRCRRRCTRC
jgi:NhaA family Na+:H+ antiporter